MILNSNSPKQIDVFLSWNEFIRPAERARVFYEYNIVRMLREKFEYLVIATIDRNHTYKQKLDMFLNAQLKYMTSWCEREVLSPLILHKTSWEYI